MSTDSHDRQSRMDAAFIRGMGWTAGAKWLTQGVTWLSVFVVARLLSPSDFGIADMAGLVTVMMNFLAEFGIGTAVLQLRDLDRRILAQLNSLSLLLGLLTVLLSVLAAPLGAWFFHLPALAPLIMWNSLGFLPTAIQAIPSGLMQKEMDYRRLSLIEAAQAMVQAVTMMICAFAGAAYWSFFISNITGRCLAAGLSYYWCPVPFNWPRWSEIGAPMRFGLEVALQRIASTVSAYSDTVIVGRVLGTASLGAYRMAINLASAPVDKLAMLIMRVTGPLFATVQDDKALMRRYFLLFTDLLALILCPLMAGFIVTAPDVIAVALGPQWAGAVGPAQWLAAYIGIRCLGILMNQILTSLHMTGYLMRLSFVGFAALPLVFYLASPYGTGAVAAGWLLTAPLTVLPMAPKVFKALDCSPWAYLKVLYPSLLSMSVMTLAVVAVQQKIPDAWPPLWRLATAVITGALVYAVAIFSLHRARIWQYIQFLKQLRSGVSAPEVQA